MLMERDKSLLMVIDIQERLLPAMDRREAVTANTALLMQAATALSVPVMISEQYPKGLGPTVAFLRDLAPPGNVFGKVHFSCADAPEIAGHLHGAGRRQIILCGIEAHVCVLQTALGLLRGGYDVFVAGDATSSRTAENRLAGHARMAAAGISMVTTEMVAFEWLHKAGTPEFKEVSKLIK